MVVDGADGRAGRTDGREGRWMGGRDGRNFAAYHAPALQHAHTHTTFTRLPLIYAPFAATHTHTCYTVFTLFGRTGQLVGLGLDVVVHTPFPFPIWDTLGDRRTVDVLFIFLPHHTPPHTHTPSLPCTSIGTGTPIHRCLAVTPITYCLCFDGGGASLLCPSTHTQLCACMGHPTHTFYLYPCLPCGVPYLPCPFPLPLPTHPPQF